MVICYFLGYGIFSDSSRVAFVISARHTKVVEIYIFTRLFLAFSGKRECVYSMETFSKLLDECGTGFFSDS